MKLGRHVRPLDLVVWSATVVFLAVAGPRAARAGGKADLEVLQAECGSCHVVYPARLLSAADWGRVLARLDRHYGVDASLDQASAAAVARQLRALRSVDSSPPGPLPRITTSAWFREQHDEVRADAWRHRAAGSAANCDACHPRTAYGDFDDDAVRIPE